LKTPVAAATNAVSSPATMHNTFLTQTSSYDSLTIPILHPMTEQDRLQKTKTKMQKEMQMKVKRLWEEEQLKRSYSRKIKKRQALAEQLGEKTITQKVVKNKEHSKLIEKTLDKKREIEEKRQQDNITLMNQQQKEREQILENFNKLKTDRLKLLQEKEEKFVGKLKRIKSQKAIINQQEDLSRMLKLSNINKTSNSII
jgi:hypothetical protein